jgi:uncharacterized protein involved in exopolysaccharide biosynthesis
MQSESIFKDQEISIGNLLIKLRSMLTYLIAKWVLILFISVLGSIIGFIMAMKTKPFYTATITFVLEESNSNLGQGGFINSLGIDLGANAGNIFSGSNFIELMTSRYIIEKALLNKFESISNNVSFADYLYFKKVSLSNKENKISNIFTHSNRDSFSLKQNAELEEIYRTVKSMIFVGKKDDRSSILCIEVRSNDELFSKAFAENLANEVSSNYIEFKSKKARQNMEILQNQTDSIRGVLNGSIVSVATAVDNTFGLNPAMQVQKTAISKKQFDVQANTAILTQLVTNLEMAKVSLRKETPLIQVIDKPILPLKKEKVSKLKSLIFGGFLAGLITSLLLVFKKIFKTL